MTSSKTDFKKETVSINSDNPIYKFVDNLQVPENLKKDRLKKVSLDLYQNKKISKFKIEELRALRD
jgi:hypothetical protein